MKNICFIGSNGFLSSTFGSYFKNIDVYGTCVPKNYHFQCFTEFDIVIDDYRLEQFLGYDVIFLFSALGVQSGGKNSTKDIFKVNTFFPIELFTFLIKNTFGGRLITFGSYFEIGCNNENIPFSEDQIINSKYKVPNDYCMSKRLLTRYISSTVSTINYWHFILPTIYGANENPNRLIPYLINAISSKNEIDLTSGFQVREYIHVEEIPEIVKKAIDLNLDSGIYNIPGQERLSIQELTVKIVNYYSYPIEKVKFGILDRKDSDMMYLALNADKLYQLLYYIPKLTITEKINDYFK